MAHKNAFLLSGFLTYGMCTIGVGIVYLTFSCWIYWRKILNIDKLLYEIK